jgi:hypothetical protein
MQRSPSISPYQSDDEVIWSLSESSASLSALSSAGRSSVLADDDDDDFVVLTKVTSSSVRRRTRRSSDVLSGSEMSDGQCSEEEGESPTTDLELPPLDLLEISGGDAAASVSSSSPPPNSLPPLPQEVVDVPKTPTASAFETQLQQDLQPPLPEAARGNAATPVAVPLPPGTVNKSPTKAQRRKAARQCKKQAKSDAAKESPKKEQQNSKISKRRKKAAKRMNGANVQGGKFVVHSTPSDLFEEASLFITSLVSLPSLSL